MKLFGLLFHLTQMMYTGIPVAIITQPIPTKTVYYMQLCKYMIMLCSW